MDNEAQKAFFAALNHDLSSVDERLSDAISEIQRLLEDIELIEKAVREKLESLE